LLLDVGGGAGRLQTFVKEFVDRYVVVDLIRYEQLDPAVEFAKVDLETGRLPFPDGAADIVAAIEVIEHLENPRAFARELTRVTRPGGLIVVTTPNQLSFLSKLTLVLKNHFNAFGPKSYPAHLSALLEIDLLRIAQECGLSSASIRYTNSGRIPGTRWHWPWPLRGRMFSDNVAMVCTR
jgi:2-polyprenyl-3-methyl-5-hydroxy-6-metoxy-1,4-benzoquinol methylase